GGGGPDLPVHAVTVGEPAALDLLAAVEQCLPQPVDLGLVLAVDQQGHGVGVVELAAAVDGGEALAGEFEVDPHDRARRAHAGLGEAGDVGDAGVGQQRTVEVRGLLGVAVVPEVGDDLLHGGFSSALFGWLVRGGSFGVARSGGSFGLSAGAGRALGPSDG